MKVLIVFSGGMDSATLVYKLLADGHEAALVSFDYGQRHARELQSAARLAEQLALQHQIIDLKGLRPLLKGSALTDATVDVPHGHYESETMKATVVPNRNAIMTSIAWGIAVAENMDAVALGIHAGDHAIYPDCRPEFAAAIETALRLATDRPNMKLLAPFIDMTKTDIAALGGQLGVRYDLTWTCYEGGDSHCGKCGACQERKEAFRDSGVADVTQYAA